MRFGSILVVCILAASLWGPCGALTCPSEPTDSWVYPYLYELRIRAGPGQLFVSTGPYHRLETAVWLKGVRAVEPGSRGEWLHEMLEAEFEEEALIIDSGSGWAGGVRFDARAGTGFKALGGILGRAAYYSPLGLCFWTSLRTSVNASGLHKVETETWRDRAQASVDYAGLAFHRDGFSISLSRDETSWGAARRTGLLFSGTAPAFDKLSIAYRRKRVAFTSFHTRLRDGTGENPEDGVRRFVAAHRIEVLPTDMISFSVSEAVIYGGRYRTFEPVYLNPFMIFYAGQWNSDWNDNILIAGDFSLLFPQVAEVRGEVMIDDFQYDFGNEPHEVGAGISVTALNPLHPGSSMIGASYYHVRNQTYGHFVSWNRFVHEDVVMGYPDGPDGDRLELWMTLASPESMVWRLDYTMRRRGEGRATDVQEATGPELKFPSGTVQMDHLAALELAWRPTHGWLLGARAGYRHTSNVEHRDGVDDNGWELDLSARFNLKMKTWLGD